MKEGTITLSKFLSRYALLDGEALYKLSHKDVKQLFPYLKRASIEKLKEDPTPLENGEVIFVDDGRTVIPYYTNILDKLPNKIEQVEGTKVTREYDYVGMTNNELKALLESKFRSVRTQAKKEIKKRGLTLKKKSKKILDYSEDYYGEY